MVDAKPYHHGDLENEVRAAALDIIAKDGPSAFTLREVASRAGVSHTAPRYHFGDKRQLLTTLATEGFELLDTMMAEAAAGIDDPRQALIAQVGAYVKLHTEHAGYAGVMWRLDLLHREDPALSGSSLAAFRSLHDTVLRVTRSGSSSLDPYQLSLMLWSLAHGVSELSSRFSPAIAKGVGIDDHAAPDDPVALAEGFSRMIVTCVTS